MCLRVPVLAGVADIHYQEQWGPAGAGHRQDGREQRPRNGMGGKQSDREQPWDASSRTLFGTGAARVSLTAFHDSCNEMSRLLLLPWVCCRAQQQTSSLLGRRPPASRSVNATRASFALHHKYLKQSLFSEIPDTIFVPHTRVMPLNRPAFIRHHQAACTHARPKCRLAHQLPAN
jgi:hypothetical protein